MTKSLTEKLTRDADGMRLYQQERAILEVTETLCQLMEEDGVSRSELAQRLGKSKGYISQLLDGRTNMTIRTISDAFVALGRALHFQEGPLDFTVSNSRILTLRTKWEQSDADWNAGISVTTRISSCGRIEKLAI